CRGGHTPPRTPGGPRLCQRPRHAFAEAARASGDQGLAAGEVELRHCPCLLCDGCIAASVAERRSNVGVVLTTVKIFLDTCQEASPPRPLYNPRMENVPRNDKF